MICALCGEVIPAPLPRVCPHCEGDPLLAGAYRLEHLAGRGSAGDTYRATRLEDGRAVAIKELPLSRARSAKARELLAREARVLRELSHPAIPRFLSGFERGRGRWRRFYIVQEFIEGRTLAEEAAETRYDQDAVLAIARELLGILVYLHELSPPVIHRDLKPENVLRRSDGRLALVDFGSVRDVLRDAELGGSTVAGTFGYMAPEQFQGEAHPRTDLYGLGALMVHLLTRREPRTLLDHSGRICWEPHVQLHPATIRFLRRMLQPELSRRMPSARVAIEDLDRVRAARRRSPSLIASAPPGALPRELAPGGRPQALDTARTPIAELELPELPAVRGEGAPERHGRPGGLSPRRGAALGAIAAALLIGLGISMGSRRGGGRPEGAAAAAPAPAVGAEEGAGLLALSYVRDPGIRACLANWRASGAAPDEALLAVAVDQAPGAAPVVSLDAGALGGTALHRCLERAAGGVRWAALEPGLRYHAKFGLPVWDDPEPLRPWPSYTVEPKPEGWTWEPTE